MTDSSKFHFETNDLLFCFFMHTDHQPTTLIPLERFLPSKHILRASLDSETAPYDIPTAIRFLHIKPCADAMASITCDVSRSVDEP